MERLASSFICRNGAPCPPTATDELAYANWPHEPNGATDASYSVCDDATSRFYAVDPFGESPYMLEFDANGRLTFAGSNLQPICGGRLQPDQAPGVMCKTCSIVREGGLKQVGAGGAGGDDGASGPERNSAGYYYCLLDENDRLVMPPGIPSDAEIACESLTVADDGTPCTGPAEYYWNGNFCVPFLCSETCVGDDCSRLAGTALYCDQVHASCYANAGIGQECNVDADCALAVRGCCGCGTIGENALMGIRVEDQAAYDDSCAPTSCPDCAADIDPSAYAFCYQNVPGYPGTCSVATR